jgi:hypothetical protein
LVEQRTENPRVGGSNPPPGIVENFSIPYGLTTSAFDFNSPSLRGTTRGIFGYFPLSDYKLTTALELRIVSSQRSVPK